MDSKQAHTRKIKWLVTQLYSGQRVRSKLSGYHQPKYSKEEFRKWLLSQENFPNLHSSWVNSGYKKMLKPSVDRLDDYKGYYFGNIRLVSWEVNRRKLDHDKINGINTKGCRTVYQFTKSGEFIKSYYSSKDAFRRTGSPFAAITNSCKGRQLSSGGYFWSYTKKLTKKQQSTLTPPFTGK